LTVSCTSLVADLRLPRLHDLHRACAPCSCVAPCRYVQMPIHLPLRGDSGLAHASTCARVRASAPRSCSAARKARRGRAACGRTCGMEAARTRASSCTPRCWRSSSRSSSTWAPPGCDTTLVGQRGLCQPSPHRKEGRRAGCEPEPEPEPEALTRTRCAAVCGRPRAPGPWAAAALPPPAAQWGCRAALDAGRELQTSVSSVLASARLQEGI